MKNFRFLTIFLLVCIISGLFGSAAFADTPAPPVLNAQAAFVGDLTTGKCVYELNADVQRAPASLTKIMTALLAVEAVESGKVSLEDMVTVSEDIFIDLAEDGSGVQLLPGEIMSFSDLLYCALLGSANDACNVIAMHIAGSVENFVAMMNARAADLGCESTHFANAHGLPDETHLSTAEDLFTIFSEALKHELFITVSSTAKHSTFPTNVSPARMLSNTNALINRDSAYGKGYVYQPAFCGKTGHTEAAGYCLISAAEKDGIRLCTVVLGCTDDSSGSTPVICSFRDSIALYDWVFGSFSYVTLLTANMKLAEVEVSMGEEAAVGVCASSDITVLLPNDTDTDSFITLMDTGNEAPVAPITAGQILGKVSVTDSEGNVLGSAKLLSEKAIALDGGSLLKDRLGAFLGHTWLLILLVAIFLIVVVYIILAVRYRKKRKAQLRRKAAAGK